MDNDGPAAYCPEYVAGSARASMAFPAPYADPDPEPVYREAEATSTSGPGAAE